VGNSKVEHIRYQGGVYVALQMFKLFINKKGKHNEKYKKTFD